MESVSRPPRFSSRSERVNPHQAITPTAEQLLRAFEALGTSSSVGTFFGVSRRTIRRWTTTLKLQPEYRQEVPINQLLSNLLSEHSARVRVAQWIVDEASISIALNKRMNTSSLILIGAINDDSAMEEIAEILAASIYSGTNPMNGRLPTHVLKIQGAKAYGILRLVSGELLGLKALEAKAARAFFPPSGIAKEE